MTGEQEDSNAEEGSTSDKTDETISWDRKNFASLDFVLNPNSFDSPDHDSIANEIEKNGIFRLADEWNFQ